MLKFLRKLIALFFVLPFHFFDTIDYFNIHLIFKIVIKSYDIFINKRIFYNIAITMSNMYVYCILILYKFLSTITCNLVFSSTQLKLKFLMILTFIRCSWLNNTTYPFIKNEVLSYSSQTSLTIYGLNSSLNIGIRDLSILFILCLYFFLAMISI